MQNAPWKLQGPLRGLQPRLGSHWRQVEGQRRAGHAGGPPGSSPLRLQPSASWAPEVWEKTPVTERQPEEGAGPRRDLQQRPAGGRGQGPHT